MDVVRGDSRLELSGGDGSRKQGWFKKHFHGKDMKVKKKMKIENYKKVQSQILLICTSVLHVGNIHFYFQILNRSFFWICQSRTLIGLCVFLVLLILMRLFGIWPFLRGPTEADREAAAEQELLEGMSTDKNN